MVLVGFRAWGLDLDIRGRFFKGLPGLSFNSNDCLESGLSGDFTKSQSSGYFQEDLHLIFSLPKLLPILVCAYLYNTDIYISEAEPGFFVHERCIIKPYQSLHELFSLSFTDSVLARKVDYCSEAFHGDTCQSRIQRPRVA